MTTTSAYDQAILQHYDEQARLYGLESCSTMLDETVRRRETDLIVRFVGLAFDWFVRSGRREVAVCDAGCGNGYTLQQLMQQFPQARYDGIEFTPALRTLAEARFQGQPAPARILAGDLRALALPDAHYDVVICQRVLVNLLDPEDQRAGLATLARLLKPGGLLLSIESFTDALANLNAARAEFNLEPLPPPNHNRYLPGDFYAGEPSLQPVTGSLFNPSLPDDFLPSNFLSSHYFVSRVLHQVALGPERPFVRNSHFVRFLTQAVDRPIGDYAPTKAHAFQKR